MDFVAVVVLSYNMVDITKKFLHFFVKNTDPKKIVLCWIDNGSSDGTVNYLKSFCNSDASNIKSKLIINKSNNGVIGGRNQGFKWFLDQDSSVNHIVFLDNDQFVGQDWLEDHLSILNYGYDIVGVEAWQMNRRFMPIRRNTSIRETFSYVGCGGMLMKRYVPEKIGLFDEEFNPSYFEDPDMCFRALDERMSIGWNVSAKVIHMPHQTLNRRSDKLDNFKKSLLYFRKKWAGRTVPLLIQKDLKGPIDEDRNLL